MSSLSVRLADAINIGIKAALSAVYTAEPGKVLKFDASTDTADIELQVNDIVDGTDGHEYPERLPTLIGVPVLTWGSGSFINRFPIQEGDPVLVICCTRNLDQWMSDNKVSNAADGRRHSLANAVCIPGLKPPGQVDSESDRDTDYIIGRIGGSQIKFKDDDEVHIAGDASYLALADSVDARFNDVWKALESHIHAATGAPPSGVAAATTAIVGTTQLTFPASVAASKVKGE